VLDYSLGLIRVRFRYAVLGGGIGASPAIFLFVYLGTTVNNIASIMNGDVVLQDNDLVIGAIALTAVVGLVLLIVRIAGKTLKEELLQ